MSNNPLLLTQRTGVDHHSLDLRNFDPGRDEIEAVCRYFGVGKLQGFEKEKGVITSHSNFFVFARAARGEFALKFYPPNADKAITIEYALNRILFKHHFPTPRMYAPRGGKPFIAGNERLAACYDFIDGKPAWQSIKEPNTVRQINTALLSIKKILSAGLKHLPLHQQADLLSRASTLARQSRALAVYDQKRIIEASLREACDTYQKYQPLFTRQRLHNNASLTNFLIYKKTAYVLDLSHIREDYALSDLASLVISCLFFNTPVKTIKAVTNDYFTRHQTGPEYFPVLNTLVRIGLAAEYLKNSRRDTSLESSAYPAALAQNYRTQLSKRKRSITAILKKMNDNPGLLV